MCRVPHRFIKSVVMKLISRIYLQMCQGIRAGIVRLPDQLVVRASTLPVPYVVLVDPSWTLRSRSQGPISPPMAPESQVLLVTHWDVQLFSSGTVTYTSLTTPCAGFCARNFLRPRRSCLAFTPVGVGRPSSSVPVVEASAAPTPESLACPRSHGRLNAQHRNLRGRTSKRT
ncbi:hypothetical protein BC826DRAFT_440293 [Russula brevipes]|nr:hypothetical protein BC826DRAFT_440293 [Russula brevipes]